MTKRKEVRVEIKVRNNLILSIMEERGIFTVAELAKRMSGTERNSIYRLVSMKLPARNVDGSWCKTALALSDFFQCMPEDLFSNEQQMLALETNRASAEMRFAEIQLLMNPQLSPDQQAELSELKGAVNAALLTLTPREHRVLALRFGLHGGADYTLEEVAEMFSFNENSPVSRERIRQIEAKALRKLQHPSRAGRLKFALR